MIRAYNNMTIGLKIFIAFGLIIAFLVVGAGMSFYSMKTFENSFGSYRSHVAAADRSRDIDYTFLDLRRAVGAFVTAGDDQSLAAAEAAVKATEAALAAGAGAMQETSRTAEMKKITDLFAGYVATWKKIADLRIRERQLVVEQVVPLGEKLKNDVQFLIGKLDKVGKPELPPIAAKASEQFNAGRLAVAQILGDGGEPALKAADAGFAGFVMRLNLITKAVGEGQEASQIGKVLKSVDAYQAAYRGAAKDLADLKTLVGKDMQDQSTAIAAAVASFRTSVMQEADTIGADTTRLADTIRTALLIAAGISVLLAMTLAAVIGRSISRPVVAIAEAMKRVSEGNLALAIPGVGRRDEVGVMADTLQVFKASLAEAEDARAAREAEERDRAAARSRELAELADLFEQAVGGIANSLAASATQLSGSAKVMSRSSADVTAKAVVVAGASQDASSSVGTVAAAAEELASSISEIGRQVNDATDIAARAVTDAAETAAKVSALSEAARKIGHVVDLINNIAGQTNLLALNATIEAARAGEAGKGFAVVAAEVKQLADQTAKATQEIGAQITAIQASTAESSDAILRITDTIGRISDVSNMVAGSVRDQGIATQEIAASVNTAARGTGAVTSNIGEVNAAAREAATAANEVLHASEALARQASSLQGELGRFLATVRAA